MTVEDRLVGEEVSGDDFPAGMRVLAVDDDKTCLKLLENLLRKCNYHVTTTTESVKALEMLRENRNMFDLVISDVNMPDMDGFKLLEQVGLEMDLPVIMLSGNGDKERVMKGVIHGACDYLMKPIRIEELQNIWQHVVRKKIDCKDHNKGTTTNEDKICNMAGVCSQDITSENIDNKNKMLGQKRKEQSEEEDDDEEDNDEENGEEPSTRKKPRFVWDAELHRKFLDVVNQLGLDKAFPKKILDLMNVEGLTRENVASHLQKYRLSLKRPAKQARIDGTLGTTDPYLQLGSLGGYGDFCTLSGSRRILSSTLPSYASSEIFCRPNASSSVLNSRGISSSTLVPPLQSQNINALKLPMFSAYESSSFLQRIRASKENQFQQNSYPTSNMKLSPIDDSSAFAVSSSFSDIIRATTINNANSYLSCFSSNHLQTHNSGAFMNHSSVGGASVKSESFNPGTSGSSNSFDYSRIKESLQSAAQLSNFASNSSPLSEDFNNDQLSQNSLKFSSPSSHFQKSPIDFSSSHVVAVPLEETMQCQEGLLGNVIKASCYTQHQNMSSTFNTLSSLASPNGDTQLPEVENLYSDARIESNDDCFLQQMISLEGFVENNCVSLDDIISETVKKDQSERKSIDGEKEFDACKVGPK